MIGRWLCGIVPLFFTMSNFLKLVSSTPYLFTFSQLREVTESEQRKLVRKPPINKNNKPTNNLNPTKPNNNDFRHYLMEKENIASSYEEFTVGWVVLSESKLNNEI